MPVIAKTLTDREVRNLKKDGFYNVGGVVGLYLRIVQPNKYWVLRYKLPESKRRDFQFAKYSDLSLKDARSKAQSYRDLVNQNIDPLDWQHNKVQEICLEERTAKIATKTFRVVAEEYVQHLVDIGQYEENSRELKLLKGRLKKHIYPVIGNQLFEEITHQQVGDVLLPLTNTQPALCKKVRQIIGQIYKWAIALGLTKHEAPTDYKVLKHLLPRATISVKHNHPMLPVKQIPEFMADLHSRPSTSARCLEFAILTAVRSYNARSAEWTEFDFEKNLWIIPAQKMKKGDLNGKHTVPLSKQAKELLMAIKDDTEQLTRYVFASPVGHSILSDASLKTVIVRMHNERLAQGLSGYVDPNEKTNKGVPRIATPHGTARATFRTWAQDDELGNDTRFSAKVAELCLHHKIDDGYNGAYERNDAMKSRQEMMQAWADYCYSYGGSKVKNDNI